MGWKSIDLNRISTRPKTIQNETPNPLGPNRKYIHPDDEKKLREIHSDVLKHEETFLTSHRNLGEEIYRVGWIPASRVLRGDFTRLRALAYTAFGGMRTALPRFDWQENCEYCARPLNQSEDQLQSVGKPIAAKSHAPSPPLTQADIDSLTSKSKDLKTSQANFITKQQELAQFIKTIGVRPTARLFDISHTSLGFWVKSALSKDPNSSRVAISRPDDNGNCRSCGRPAIVDVTEQKLAAARRRMKKKMEPGPGQTDILSPPVEPEPVETEEPESSKPISGRTEHHWYKGYTARGSSRCSTHPSECPFGGRVQEGDSMVTIGQLGRLMTGEQKVISYCHAGKCAEATLKARDEQRRRFIERMGK